MGKINKIQKLLQKQAEINRQIMILGTVLFAVGIMSIATIRITDAATDADTNVAQNVSVGALAITAPSELAFNSGGVGLNKQTAEKFARRLELVLLVKYGF